MALASSGAMHEGTCESTFSGHFGSGSAGLDTAYVTVVASLFLTLSLLLLTCRLAQHYAGAYDATERLLLSGKAHTHVRPVFYLYSQLASLLFVIQAFTLLLPASPAKLVCSHIMYYSHGLLDNWPLCFSIEFQLASTASRGRAVNGGGSGGSGIGGSGSGSRQGTGWTDPRHVRVARNALIGAFAMALPRVLFVQLSTDGHVCQWCSTYLPTQNVAFLDTGYMVAYFCAYMLTVRPVSLCGTGLRMRVRKSMRPWLHFLLPTYTLCTVASWLLRSELDFGFCVSAGLTFTYTGVYAIALYRAFLSDSAQTDAFDFGAGYGPLASTDDAFGLEDALGRAGAVRSETMLGGKPGFLFSGAPPTYGSAELALSGGVGGGGGGASGNGISGGAAASGAAVDWGSGRVAGAATVTAGSPAGAARGSGGGDSGGGGGGGAAAGSGSSSDRSIQARLLEVARMRVTVIPWEELTVTSRIGRGGYGEVYRGAWHGTRVAIKRLLPLTAQDDTGGDVLARFAHEVGIMAAIRHPHLVLLMGVSVTRQQLLCIVTELVPQGSVYDVITTRRDRALADLPLAERPRTRAARSRLGALTPAECANVLLDASRGMAYLHGLEPAVVHRDLKSMNLLVDAGGHVKVCDFGLSRELFRADAAQSRIGTVQWASPELMKGESYGPSVDVWSLGVVLWECLSGEPPFEGVDPVVVVTRVALDGYKLGPPADCPLALEALFNECTQRTPGSRPSFEALVPRLEALCRELAGATSAAGVGNA